MRRLLTVCLIFIISYGLILKKVEPGVMTGDSAEFTVNAVTLGLNHPAGYPLYSLLGKIVAGLPLGNLAFRLNLSSSFLTALAAAILALLLSQNGPLFLAALVSVLLPLGRVTFSQSVSAEVYTLNLCLFSLLIYLVNYNSLKTLALIILLWSVALGNHYLTLLALPLVLWSLFSVKLDSRLILKLALLAGLGLAVYLYLPLRAVKAPPINWGDPQFLDSLTAHLKRSEYHKLEFGRIVSVSDKLGYLLHFFKLSVWEFSPLIFLAGISGLAVILRTRKSWGLILLLEYLLYGLGLIFLLRFPFRIQDVYRVTVYYLPAFFLLLLCSFSGLNLVYQRMRDKPYSKYLFPLLLIWPLSHNLLQPARRLNFITSGYLLNLTAFAPPNGQLVTEGDNETFGLFYNKYVAAVRPDIEIFNLYEKELRSVEKLSKGAPVLYANGRNAPPRFRPHGLMYFDTITQVNPWRYYNMAKTDGDFSTWENFEREIIANFFLFQGQGFLSSGQGTRAIEAVKKAARIGREFAWVNNHAGAFFAGLKLNQEAAYYYRQAIKADPYYLEACFNLGILLARQNDPAFRRILRSYLELSEGIEPERPFRQRARRLLTNYKAKNHAP